MANATDYLEQQIINTYLRGQATFVALATQDPTDEALHEVTALEFPAYARQAADNGGGTGSGWSDPGSTQGETSNTNKLIYAVFDGPDDLDITHWIVFDALTSGNAIVHAQLTEPRTLRTGDRLIFDPDSLTVTVA